MRPRAARPTVGDVGAGSTPRRKRMLRDLMIPLLEQVDRLRVESGMSQRELAGRVGLSQPTFSAILTGARLNLRMQTLHEFVSAMGLDLYLMVRFRCPLAPVNETTLFECYCGWSAHGPGTEVALDPLGPEPETGRWRLQVRAGSDFSRAVTTHVVSCPHATLRYVVECIQP